MDVLTTTKQEIHIIVKVITFPSPQLLSSIYGSPRFEEFQILWENLCSVSLLHDLPWAIVGDFNDVITNSKKRGGGSLHRITAYRNYMNFCNMIDLGFFGVTFTQTNRRDINALIQQKIDRCWANSAWNLIFPNANVTHLPKVSLDHYPLLLSLYENPQRRLERPFHFEKMWLNHPRFQQVVEKAQGLNPSLGLAISTFKTLATTWNKEIFGSIFARKRKLLS